jgi:hypothetical protein
MELTLDGITYSTNKSLIEGYYSRGLDESDPNYLEEVLMRTQDNHWFLFMHVNIRGEIRKTIEPLDKDQVIEWATKTGTRIDFLKF